MGALSNMVGEIRLDASGVDKGVSDAESSMSGLGDTAQSVGSSMQSAGKTMTAGVTAPLAAMGGMAAREAATFEKSMAKSIAVMGDVDEAMRQDLEQTARDVAKSTTLSHEEAAESFYFLSSAGLDAAESMEAMPQVAKLAEAGQLDMADATDYATNIMSSFGKEAGDLDTIVDQMSATFSNHNQTAQDVGQGLAKIGPVASSVGMSMEDAAAAIGMLGDVGYSGTEAATALRGSMTRLMNPTGKAKDTLEELGVQVMDSSGDMRSMGDILRDLEAGGASAQQMMQIFGQEAGPAMQSMLGQGGDALDEYSAAIKDSEGAAQDIAETQRDTLMGSIDILKSNVTDLAISFGAELTPVLRRAADFASTLSERFGNLSPSTRKLIVAAAALAAAIGPLLFVFGTILTMVPAMTAGFATLSGILGGAGLVAAASSAAGILGGGLLTALGLIFSPLGLLIGTVAALAAAFYTDFAGIRTVAMEVFGAIRKGLKPIISLLGFFKDRILSDFREGFVGLSGSAEESIGKIVSAVGDWLIPQITAFFNQAKLLLDRAYLWWADHGDQVIGAVNALVRGVEMAFTIMANGIRVTIAAVRAILGPFVGWLSSMWAQHGQKIMAEARETWAVVREQIGNFVAWARPYVAVFVDWIKSAFRTALNAISRFWSVWGEDIMAHLRMAVDTARLLVEQLIDFMSTTIRVGLAIIRGDWSEAWDLIEGYVGRTVGRIEELVSGWVDVIVGYIQTFVEDGIAWFKELYRKLVGGSIVPDMLDDILSAFKNILGRVLDAITSFVPDAVGEFRDFASDALDALTSKVSDFKSAGKSLITAVGDGIRDNVNKVKGKVEGAAQKIRDYWPSSPAEEGPLSDIDKIGPGMMRTIADSISSSSGIAESATASAAEAVEGAFQLGGAQEKYIASIAENYDWGPGGGSGDDSLGPGADPSVSRRARELLEESGIHESTLGELSHAEALGEALSRGLMEVPEHFEENQDMLTPDWFDDADERARRLGGIGENTGKVMAEDGSYVDPSFWSGAGEKLAEGASNTLQSIVDSAGEFDGGAAREALSTLGTSQRLELSNALENSKWFDKSYEASRQIRDAVENGNLSQQLYDALISDSGVYGELESLVNEGDRQEELVRAEDGSMVPKSFYDNAPPEVTQEVNIDFAGLDDDAWISVGALKEEFAKHQDKREERERNRSVRTY